MYTVLIRFSVKLHDQKYTDVSEYQSNTLKILLDISEVKMEWNTHTHTHCLVLFSQTKKIGKSNRI